MTTRIVTSGMPLARRRPPLFRFPRPNPPGVAGDRPLYRLRPPLLLFIPGGLPPRLPEFLHRFLHLRRDLLALLLGRYRPRAGLIATAEHDAGQEEQQDEFRSGDESCWLHRYINLCNSLERIPSRVPPYRSDDRVWPLEGGRIYGRTRMTDDEPHRLAIDSQRTCVVKNKPSGAFVLSRPASSSPPRRPRALGMLNNSITPWGDQDVSGFMELLRL